MRTLRRIAGMMLHPETKWNAVARDMPGAVVLLRNFLLPLSLLAPVATTIGLLVFDSNWNAEYGYAMLRERAPVIAVTTYVFEIVSVYLLAAIFYLFARTEGRSPSFLATLRVAVFGSIPLLLSGATLFIPFNVIFSMFAMLYSLYLYHMGATRLLGIGPSDATMFVGVTMICMLIVSGFMGGFASMLGIL